MRSLLVAFFVVLVAAPVLAVSVDDIENSPPPTYDPPLPGPTYDFTRETCYDNGPWFNQPGTPMWSTLQDLSLGMSVYGFGHQIVNNNMVSDDFTIPAGESWTIDELVFAAYQTGSSTNSTINDYRVQILDGPPDNPGSAVVWGDLNVNALGSSVWAGIYRDLESAPGATNRPIMASTIPVGMQFGEGQYWPIWQAGGTLSSGPWAPPLAIWNVCTTGDGYQGLAGVWAFVTDTGSGCPQGFPMLVNGTCAPTPTEEGTWGQIKNLFR